MCIPHKIIFDKLSKSYIAFNIELHYYRNIIVERKDNKAMPASKAQQKAVSKYMKTNYDVFQIRMPKGRKAEIKSHADSQEESINSFINRAINETIERDNLPKNTEK